MNVFNNSGVDSDLLKVFCEVYATGNATAAAKRLNLTQSAVSHSIAKLRIMFNDQLFIRSSHGLKPTPRATGVFAKAVAILNLVDDLLNEGRTFNPLTDEFTFRIAATDYFEQTMMPKLLSHLEKHAPRVTLVMRPTGGALPNKEMEAGDIDLAIAGFYRDIPAAFFQQQLFTDDFVCVAGKSAKGGSMTLPRYVAGRHLVISPQGDLKTKAREQVKKLGHDLNYAAGVSSFLSPAKILQSSNLLLTCPRKLAESFNHHGDFKIFELPIKMDKIGVMQVWHERTNTSEAHKWLRRVVKEACKG